ncbi:MobH family relaxase [Pseudomonas gingeri]|uniref:TraI domain-containing protein n=1 Tax=Pseudomonas gingeri TaxID=117681 RepID=A0A7Y8CKG8_9PSED|nr:MobH family relaxase [Pseudomonas gingeri]NWB28917.1 TraI domain-containing protein [Pseudomonas gingeri]NWC34011.1 TraI domain-containing protein [Pseudomonas gingeri]NWE28074.1 TraI domain-containing protein [Pseudomonas gingeri]NWE94029.1 TraI domain-containing protein [Pseudomonas gingeri]
MFWRSKLKKAADHAATPRAVSNLGYLLPKSAAELLSTPRRRQLLEHIWQRTSLSRNQFADLYLRPIERYAELVQQLPASESRHHAYLGGMLDHALESVAYALKIRQSHLLPVGADPETQALQAEAWSATIAYAALLHGIGRIFIDMEVHLADGSVWHPWHGSIRREYRFRYSQTPSHTLPGAATGLLYAQLLPASILDWLSAYPEPLAALIHALSGHYEQAGVLAEVLAQADQASLALEQAVMPARMLAVPGPAAQQGLLPGLDSADERMNDGDLGQSFMTWLRQGVQSGAIAVNEANAKVHGVAGTALLVTPKIFQRYAREHPDIARIAKAQDSGDWQWVQRCFERLESHRKRADGLNIWTCEMKDPRRTRRLNGYLLIDPLRLFSELPQDNPCLSLREPPSVAKPDGMGAVRPGRSED